MDALRDSVAIQAGLTYGFLKMWRSYDRFKGILYERTHFFSHTHLYFFLTSSHHNIYTNQTNIQLFEDVMKWWQIPSFHIWERFHIPKHIYISHTNLYFFLTSSLLNIEYNLVYILVRSLQESIIPIYSFVPTQKIGVSTLSRSQKNTHSQST